MSHPCTRSWSRELLGCPLQREDVAPLQRACHGVESCLACDHVLYRSSSSADVAGDSFGDGNWYWRQFYIYRCSVTLLCKYWKIISCKNRSSLNGISIHGYLVNKKAQSMFLSPVTEEVVGIVRTCNNKTSN